MSVTADEILTRCARALPYLVIAFAALLLALAITPPVSVSAFGQTVQVGAVTPNLELGFSGPGQADLFGAGSIDTVQQFSGPIRPRIVWQRFNRNDQASQFIQSSSVDGHRVVQAETQELGADLARGWTVYFLRLLVIAGALGGALYLLGVGSVSLLHESRRNLKVRRHYAVMLAVTVSLTLLLTAGSGALTLMSARSQLTGIQSLSDLTGTARLAPAAAAIGPARSDIDAVVIGDSTAAGIGNQLVADPSPQDRACDRSRDAYAAVLQRAARLRVLNLACSSATITHGLLGPQLRASQALPAQIGVLKSITSASTVVVSIGANDMGWSDFLRYCYGLARCDDQASESLFQSRMDAFRIQYAQLLQELADLPGKPKVIVTAYYDPFGKTFDCPQLTDPARPNPAPSGYGFSADPGGGATQDQKIATKIEPLRSELAQINAVLGSGAGAFGFTLAQPEFQGHELCSEQPWVQGLSDPAPFHPNAAGELAIAAAALPLLSQPR